MSEESEDYRDVIRQGLESALRAQPCLAPAVVEEICRDLLARPAAQRSMLLRNSQRLCRVEVCCALIRLSEDSRHSDLGTLQLAAEVAIEVAEALPTALPSPSIVADTRAEAWSNMANVERIRRNFPAAQRALERAWEYAQEGTGEPFLTARLQVLQGNFHFAADRIAEAIPQYRRALSAYRHLGDQHLAGRTLVTLAVSFKRVGRLNRAIQCAAIGARRLSPEREPELRIQAIYNLILYLEEAGHLEEARILLVDAERLFASSRSPAQHIRKFWLEARISRGCGDFEAAITALSEVRARFLAQDLGFDHALATLELTALHAELGHWAEVSRLAAECYPILVAGTLPREALATLVLFVQSVERREASAERLAELALTLRGQRETAR